MSKPLPNTSGRFGGIESHFKDYKSAAFDLLRSRIRDAQALTCLLVLLAMAQLLAIHLGFFITVLGQRAQLDWHSRRGLSFLQLGLRELQRLCHLRLPLPPFQPLPYNILFQLLLHAENEIL